MPKHLLMHVWPRETGAWRLTVREVASRMHLFDGRKVVAIAVGRETEAASSVMQEFPSGVEFIVTENDPSLREVKTFVPLMERVEDLPGHTFYCHGKGSSHPEESICQEWGRVMCEVLLDHVEVLEGAMKSRPVMGCFRRSGRFGMQPNNWHYSGTFYWINNVRVFKGNKNWMEIDQCWFGTEAWPGHHWDSSQTACAFMDWCGDLYEEQYWRNEIRPRLETWRKMPRLATNNRSEDECDFMKIADGYSRCVKCERVVHDTRLLRYYKCGHRRAQLPGQCLHAEEVMTTVGDVKVWSCPEHGACAPTAVGCGVHVCSNLEGNRFTGFNCMHLGERLRSVDCEQCGAGKTSPVFACSKHGEALLHQVRGVDVHSCEGCPDAQFSSVHRERQSV